MGVDAVCVIDWIKIWLNLVTLLSYHSDQIRSILSPTAQTSAEAGLVFPLAPSTGYEHLHRSYFCGRLKRVTP